MTDNIVVAKEPHPNSYALLFRNAFNPTPPFLVNPVARERIAMAIAAYMRTLVSDISPFDLGTMSLDEVQGQMIFQNNGCTGCHTNSSGIFSDGRLHNIGLPNHSRSVKTPTLRNMGLRKRFMHSGQFASIDECLDFYNQEIPGTNPNFPFNPPLSPTDKLKVKAFLENALTDPRVAMAQFPFDRPTLHSEISPFQSNIYGASTSGSGGQNPIMIGHSPENVGNADFKIGIGNALGGAQALLGFSFAAANPGTIVIGIPLHIDLTPGIFIGFETVNPLPGIGAGQGTATRHLPNFTSLPALAGTSFFGQWFVVDPAGPQGLVGSSGASFTIF